jgi:peptidoglycan DL-endopeptidase CwlO
MRWGRLHAGIDIAAPAGTPIRAALPGRVLVRGWVGGYGNLTCLAHGLQLATCYAHQSRFEPGVVQSVPVARGQVIGYVGCTGRCFGDHLHFEVHTSTVISNASAVDPMPYLAGER